MSLLRFFSHLETNCQNSWAVIAIEETSTGELLILMLGAYPTRELAESYVEKLRKAGLPGANCLTVCGPEPQIVDSFLREIPDDPSLLERVTAPPKPPTLPPPEPVGEISISVSDSEFPRLPMTELPVNVPETLGDGDVHSTLGETSGVNFTEIPDAILGGTNS